MSAPRWLGEAATVLKVSEQILKRELRAGRLPGANVGGRWRISRRLHEQSPAGEWQPPTQPTTAGHRG